MANCDNCFDRAKSKEQDYETIKQQAKDYAVTHQKDMALYNENGEWLFAEVQTAISNGIPFREVVSKHP
jgi:hypothetical protein